VFPAAASLADVELGTIVMEPAVTAETRRARVTNFVVPTAGCLTAIEILMERFIDPPVQGQGR
jgi:hypothetical protein